MNDLVLFAKAAVALLGCVAVVLLLRRRPFDALSDRAFTRAAFGSLAALRLGVYVVVFILAGVAAQSDVITYYDLGKHALAGEVPYRDFFNGYAPFFPYAASLPLRLWDSPKSIVLLSVLCELASLPFWLDVGRRIFGERVTRDATVLYLWNPLLLCATPLGGQNHVWLSLTLAISLHLLVRRKDLASGLVFGAGVVIVKFLSLLHAPVLFIAASRRVRWGLGCLAVIAAVYGALFLGQISPLASLKYHSVDASSGNLPYLLTLFRLDPHDPTMNRVYNLIGVTVLGVVFLIPLARYRAFDPRQTLHLIAVLLFTLLLVSRKSYANYLVMAFFAICASVASTGLGRRALGAFLALSVLAAVEPSLWFRWLRQAGLHVLWESPLPEGLSRFKVVLFFAVELALLGSYVACLVASYRRLGEARQPGPESLPDPA